MRPSESAPRSRRDRCCARWPSRATRLLRRRRSCPTPGRRRRGTRASSHRTGRGGSSRDGRRRSRARSTLCGCRSEAACVTSPPRCRRLFETTDDSRGSFSSVAHFDQRMRRAALRRRRSHRGHPRRPATGRPRRAARCASALARSIRSRSIPQLREAQVAPARLPGAEELTLAAQLEVDLGELEAVGRLDERLEARLRDVGQLELVAGDEQAVASAPPRARRARAAGAAARGRSGRPPGRS